MAVDLKEVAASNALLSTAQPPGLVAVFLGGTGGIGEYTLKAFAAHATKPRIFNVGRNADAGARIGTEVERLNAGAQYTFLRADTSLLATVDEVCRTLAAQTPHVDVLVTSTSSVELGARTAEGLHTPVAVTVLTRLRMTLNLLPLLARAPAGSPRRVVTVLAGGREGPLQSADMQARDVQAASVLQVAPHIATVGTLALERAAARAPAVAFVHSNPGTVRTPLYDKMSADERAAVMAIHAVHGVPQDEAGERHLFLCTSARFAGAVAGGVPSAGGVVAVGTDGKVGSGVYCTGPQDQGTEAEVVENVGKLRAESGETVWAQIVAEFERVTGKVCIEL